MAALRKLQQSKSKRDRLQVLPGDQIATDGKILSGISSINEASINGESVPREKTVGDEVFRKYDQR